MSSKIFSYSQGCGQDLVLLHGWGVNSGVWESFIPQISADYRITCIDLPGFGRSTECLPQHYNLADIVELVQPHIPTNSVLMGWSLGGLVASQLAINKQIALRGLINVASSPKFIGTQTWPGIAPQVLQMFAEQLEGNFTKTLDRFLAIQAMGSDSARQDVKTLKKSISQYPAPATQALYGGLDILQTADLRDNLIKVHIPVLNCFGRLDSLVPQKAHQPIERLYGNNHQRVVFPNASHAPFISSQADFVNAIGQFVRSLPN